ncbi:MAG: hypothetical protein ACPGJV_14910 [Bacteriovoracaceae bacterium]
MESKKRRSVEEILNDLKENHKKKPSQKEIEDLAEIINEKSESEFNDIPVEKIAASLNKDHSSASEQSRV